MQKSPTKQTRRYSVAANTRVYSRTCVYQFPCWSIFVCTTCYIIIHVYTTIHVYIVIHICINTRHSFSSLPQSSSVRDFVFFVCVSIAIESYMSYQFLYTNIFVCTNCYIIKHVFTTVHVYIVIHVCISTRHSFSCLSTVVFSSWQFPVRDVFSSWFSNWIECIKCSIVLHMCNNFHIGITFVVQIAM